MHNAQILHTIQLAMVLVSAILLIVFCHQWVNPDTVFVAMVSSVAGIVGSRIAANNYSGQQKNPPLPVE